MNSFFSAYIVLVLYVEAPGSEIFLEFAKCCGDFWLAASLCVRDRKSVV